VRRKATTVAPVNTPDGVLLPYQSTWIENTSPIKLWEKSRRIGASYCEAADDALHAAKASGGNVWHMGQDKESAQRFIQDVAFWAGFYHLAASEIEESVFDAERDIMIYTIRFASGYAVHALPSVPQKLRSKGAPGERFIFDECAFHDDFNGLLKAAMALRIWGCELRFLSTHNGEDNPFNEFIEEVRAGKRGGYIHKTTFDEAVADGLYLRICLKLNRPWTPDGEREWVAETRKDYGDDAGEELDVIPSQGSGVFLSRAQVKHAMRHGQGILVARLARDHEFTYAPVGERRAFVETWIDDYIAPALARLNPQLLSFMGQDFGLTGDLSSIVVLQEQQDLRLKTGLVVELSNIPYDQQKQIFQHIADRVKLGGAAIDSRGNGQIMGQEMAQAYGSEAVLQVMPSDKWYSEAMPLLKSHVADDTLVIAQDADILDDFRQIKKINGVPKFAKTTTKGADKRQRHGDTAMGYVLAVYAVERSEGPITSGYIQVPEYDDDSKDSEFMDIDYGMGGVV
jgi:phage FluMu gp28-like protein